MESLLHQNIPENIELDILVCASPGTDRTEEIVLEMAKKHPEIRLITTPIIGKAYKWNMVKEKARSDIVVYCDADIVIEKSAVRLLYEDLMMRPELQLVGANIIMRIEGSKGLMRLINPILAKSPPKATLNGRLYAIRRDAIEDIPSDIINEDEWLSLKILTSGEQRFGVDSESKAYYTPPLTLTDHIQYKLRCYVGTCQIKREYPELNHSYTSTFRGRGNFLKNLSFHEKMVLPLLAGIYFYCKALSWVAYETKRITHEFDIVKSTKKVL